MTPKNVAPSTPRSLPAFRGSVDPGEEELTLPNRRDRRVLTASRLQELSAAKGQRRDDLVAELVLINRPVAWSIAGRFTGRGVELEDLRQVAVFGLYKSVLRFDLESRHDLLSFAIPTITGEIRRWFRDQGWMVRPPRRIQELQQRTGAVVEQLGHSLGRTPTAREVAAELGVSEAEHREAEAAHGAFRAVSLDQPVGEGGVGLCDLVTDGRDPYGGAEARLALAPALAALDPGEKRVLELRFGGELSQREIGRRTGMSQAQVSRTLASLLDRLRRDIEGASAPDAQPRAGSLSVPPPRSPSGPF